MDSELFFDNTKRWKASDDHLLLTWLVTVASRSYRRSSMMVPHIQLEKIITKPKGFKRTPQTNERRVDGRLSTLLTR